MKNKSPCPICHSESIESHMVTYDFRLKTTKDKIFLSKCNNSDCMHIWSALIPSEEEIKSFYKNDFYKHSKKQTDPITSLNRNNFLSCLRKYGGNKILDVGAGDGSFVSFLREKGFNAKGIEPSREGREMAKKLYSLDLIEKNISDFDPKVEKYDIINLSHVLEHVQDPMKMLKKIIDLLEDHGSLTLEVPNSNSWEMKIFKSIYIHIDSPRHIHHFNKKSLSILLSNAGFSSESNCENLSIIQFPLSGIRSIENFLDFYSKNSIIFKFIIKLMAVPYAFLSIFINSLASNKICLSGAYSKKLIKK